MVLGMVLEGRDDKDLVGGSTAYEKLGYQQVSIGTSSHLTVQTKPLAGPTCYNSPKLFCSQLVA